MIVLDRDVLEKVYGSNPDPDVVEHMKRYSSVEWTIPSLVAFETYRALDSRSEMTRARGTLSKSLDRIIDFDDDAAFEAAYIEERLAAQNTSLDPVDLLNLATAHARGATFVTHNSDDFDRGPIRSLCDVDVVYTSN